MDTGAPRRQELRQDTAFWLASMHNTIDRYIASPNRVLDLPCWYQQISSLCRFAGSGWQLHQLARSNKGPTNSETTKQTTSDIQELKGIPDVCQQKNLKQLIKLRKKKVQIKWQQHLWSRKCLPDFFMLKLSSRFWIRVYKNPHCSCAFVQENIKESNKKKTSKKYHGAVVVTTPLLFVVSCSCCC